LVGIASSAASEVWGLVWAFLCEWGNHAADNDSAGNIYLADAVLDMLSATFAERLLSETPIPSKRILRERVCAIADFVLHAFLFVTVTLYRSRCPARSAGLQRPTHHVVGGGQLPYPSQPGVPAG
jgi:hypothetical protein